MAYKKAHAPHSLAILGDPSRRAILERLTRRPMLVGEVADGLPISRPAVSQHLKALREAGLVEVEQDGTRRLYRANPRALADLRRYIDGLWEQSFRAMKKSAEGGDHE